MENPCRWCTDRNINCHGTCEKYKEWKKVINEQNRKIRIMKDSERIATNDIIKGIRRKRR